MTATTSSPAIPLPLRAEIQLAGWEWGAGRYPDWRATLFYSPLILLGAMTMPRAEPAR